MHVHTRGHAQKRKKICTNTCAHKLKVFCVRQVAMIRRRTYTSRVPAIVIKKTTKGKGYLRTHTLYTLIKHRVNAD